jgi:hypothetical protein
MSKTEHETSTRAYTDVNPEVSRMKVPDKQAQTLTLSYTTQFMVWYILYVCKSEYVMHVCVCQLVSVNTVMDAAKSPCHHDGAINWYVICVTGHHCVSTTYDVRRVTVTVATGCHMCPPWIWNVSERVNIIMSLIRITVVIDIPLISVNRIIEFWVQ